MKHAIISGGCSGIGLHLARHLLSRTDEQWRLVIADINAAGWSSLSPPLDPQRTLFIQTDTSNWDSQAALLKQAYTWSNSRLDAYFANAGIGDRDSFFLPWDLDAEPTKPDLSCVEVCETANYYALKLFMHYSRKTIQALGGREQAAAQGFHPKLVFTASCVALYSFPIAPQYNAAKHAVLGLTRAIGEWSHEMEGVAVNCIMPAVIDTPILPGNFKMSWPREYITPFETLNRAFDELIDVEGKVAQDGKSNGENGVVKSGKAIECAVDKLYYRAPHAPPDESQKFMVEDSVKRDGLWMQAITDVLKARAEAQASGQKGPADELYGGVKHVEKV